MELVTLKKGQGTVEYLLIMVALLPIIFWFVGWLKTNFVDKLNTSLKYELSCNIRYGYSCAVLKKHQDLNEGLMENVRGEPPYMYQKGTFGHPLSHVQEGWKN